MDKPILKAKLGEAIKIQPAIGGDLWTCAWAQDGTLYTATDDSGYFEQENSGISAWENGKPSEEAEMESSNVAFHRLTGEDPRTMKGCTINRMAPYGKAGQAWEEDGASWKACGLTCVDGVLYMSVARAAYFSELRRYSIQKEFDTSIIKSEDSGRTWSSVPTLGKAMFPGKAFGTLMFLDYGRDGDQEDWPHGADKYVYAISNDGSWNNGNYMIMGRVARSHIGRLDPADWEFIHDFKEDGSPVWRPGHLQANAIFHSPGKTSMAPVHYIKALGLYILPQWYFPDQFKYDRPVPKRFTRSMLTFYYSDKPWGPWTLFYEKDFSQVWYDPFIPSKFISSDGKNMWVFLCGSNWGINPRKDKYYSLWMMPMELERII